MEVEMRKSIALIIGLVVAVSFIGCSSKDTSSSKSVSVSTQKVLDDSSTKKDEPSDNTDNTQRKSDKMQASTIEDSKEIEKPKVPEKPKAPSSDNKEATASKNANTSANNTANASTNVTTTAVVAAKTTAGNKVIVIDPGHANRSNLEKEPTAPGSSQMKIKDGGGAEGVGTKVSEQSINLKVAFKLRDLLQSRGYTVIMTKTREDQSLGNVERAEVGNKANAALVIRIHADSADTSSAKGASMLVPAAINENTKAIYAASKSYGITILNTLVGEVGMSNRGIIESSDMTGFNWSKVPVVLIEMGFLSNPQEDKLLASQAYQDKLAKGLADGISNAVK
jgi:N-acetylmuramoyl-L-alanine amidase